MLRRGPPVKFLQAYFLRALTNTALQYWSSTPKESATHQPEPDNQLDSQHTHEEHYPRFHQEFSRHEHDHGRHPVIRDYLVLHDAA